MKFLAFLFATVFAGIASAQPDICVAALSTKTLSIIINDDVALQMLFERMQVNAVTVPVVGKKFSSVDLKTVESLDQSVKIEVAKVNDDAADSFFSKAVFQAKVTFEVPVKQERWRKRFWDEAKLDNGQSVPGITASFSGGRTASGMKWDLDQADAKDRQRIIDDQKNVYDLINKLGFSEEYKNMRKGDVISEVFGKDQQFAIQISGKGEPLYGNDWIDVGYVSILIPRNGFNVHTANEPVEVNVPKQPDTFWQDFKDLWK